MDSDSKIIDELKKRNFKLNMFIDLGPSYFKDYQSDNYYYSIIVSLNNYGQVHVVNYIDNVNDNIICLNDSKELKDDLLYILKNLKEKN